jgi:NADH-quinone oxidoreductase subunit A
LSAPSFPEYTGVKEGGKVKDSRLNAASSHSSSRRPVYIRFYLIAMLFILFDIEVVFLFPWAVVFKTLSWSGFWSILIFIVVLGAGYVYAWRKGAFQWE